MDTVLDRPWTTDAFIAWEDRQEGRHEFNGREIIPMTVGSLAHQDIVFNLWETLVNCWPVSLSGLSRRCVS